MAFVNFKTCCRDAKQLIRLVVLLICICVSCYQLTGCLRKIRHPPISTHYGFNLNETLRYPAVTICRNPPYKTELFEKYGFKHNDIKYSTAWKSFKYENYSLQEFFEETTYSFNEVITFSAFDGKPENFKESSFFTFNYGRCITVAPVNASKYWGNKYGYFFIFYHSDGGRTEGAAISPAGFHINIQDEVQTFSGRVVCIHKKNSEKCQQSDIFREYLYVEPGYYLQVNLRMSKYNRLPSNNNNCSLYSGYSKSRCDEDYVNKHISEDVGCSTPWIPNEKLPPCNSYEQVKKMIEYSTPSEYLTSYLQGTNCPESCNATSYQPFVQSISELPLPHSALRIYFSSNLYTQMEEVVGYDWNNFLADLGGSLGFLLGLSVLGAITIVEQLIAIAIRIKQSRKASAELNNSCRNEDLAVGTAVATKNEFGNEDAVNCKNKINEYQADFEFYSKKT